MLPPDSGSERRREGEQGSRVRWDTAPQPGLTDCPWSRRPGRWFPRQGTYTPTTGCIGWATCNICNTCNYTIPPGPTTIHQFTLYHLGQLQHTNYTVPPGPTTTHQLHSSTWANYNTPTTQFHPGQLQHTNYTVPPGPTTTHQLHSYTCSTCLTHSSYNSTWASHNTSSTTVKSGPAWHISSTCNMGHCKPVSSCRRPGTFCTECREP